jgi:hypothetical protein
MAVDIGQGTFINFSGVLGSAATGVYKLTGLSWSGIERAVADATHMLTSGGKEYVASEVYDPGEVSAEVLFDPSVKPWTALTNVATTQAVEVRFAAGGTTTVVWSAYGYVTGFEAGSQMEDMQTGTVTIKLSGSVT